MTKTNFRDGYLSAIQNAESLAKISGQAAEENEYGIACSLNILAAEEALKAIFLITKHYNPKGKITHFDEIFKDHKIKHKHLKELVLLQEVLLERNKENLKIIEPALAQFDMLPDEIKKPQQKLYEEIKSDVEWFRNQIENSINTTEIINWLSQANDDKNKGFYVDIKNNSWISPKSITKDKFIKESRHTSAIFVFVKTVEETYERQQIAQNRG